MFVNIGAKGCTDLSHDHNSGCTQIIPSSKKMPFTAFNTGKGIRRLPNCIYFFYFLDISVAIEPSPGSLP